MAIKEKDLPVSGSYGPGVYVRTVSASGASQKTGFAAMKEALDPTVDSALSTSSTNAVQNKVITGAINDVQADVDQNAGEISDLKEDLKEDINSIATITKPLDLKSYPYAEGYLTTGGVFVADPGGSQKTTNPISLPAGNYTVDFVGVYNSNPILYVRAIAVYNANDVCTNFYMTGSLKNFTVLENDSYVRINVNAQTITEYEAYLTSTGGEVIGKIKNEAIVTDKTLSVEGDPADAKATGDRISEIANVNTGVIIDESYDEWENGYINLNTGELVPTTNTQHTTDYIELEKGLSYGFVCNFTINDETLTRPRAIVTYNADRSFSRSISPRTTITNIVLTGNEKYVRININYDTVNSMTLFENRAGLNGTVITIDENTIIPQIKKENYSHARRPLIAFVLDGDYDLNATMEGVFSNHNIGAGFAIPYTDPFTVNPISTYFDWERKGHEILAHSAVAVGPNGTATDEQIAQIVKDCYNTMAGYGFDIHGFVAYQGSTKPVTVANVEKWFDYGFDASNHSAAQESCLFFASDAPYMLWRYSMQLSTLQEMKDAVDRCLDQTGLLVFYGHANSSTIGNFTPSNLESLLSYIDSKEVKVKTPTEAVSDFYSIRYEDIQ